MSRPIQVRRAVKGDAGVVGQAHAAAWVAAYDHIFEWEFLLAGATGRRGGWSQTIERLLQPPNLLLVGEVDGRVVAFAHARPAEDGRAEVRGFYCHPYGWGSGIAALLMSKTTAVLADEFNEVFLWTLRDAGRARRFYEKLGYRPTGNERPEPLTDWSTGVTVERPAVEYARTLS
jgi:GNAT superfamily N-acetyltransferase